jgi:hypothetical protein
MARRVIRVDWQAWAARAVDLWAADERGARVRAFLEDAWTHEALDAQDAMRAHNARVLDQEDQQGGMLPGMRAWLLARGYHNPPERRRRGRR